MTVSNIVHNKYLNLLGLINKLKNFHVMLPDSWQNIAFFQGYQDSPVFPFDKTNIKTKMNMKHYCITTDREQPDCSERNLSLLHFVYHMYHQKCVSRILAVRGQSCYSHEDWHLYTLCVSIRFVYKGIYPAVLGSQFAEDSDGSYCDNHDERINACMWGKNYILVVNLIVLVLNAKL